MPYLIRELTAAEKFCFNCPLPDCVGINHGDCPLPGRPKRQRQQIQSPILALLARESLTKRQIVCRLGANTQSVASALTRLYRRGEVARRKVLSDRRPPREVFLYTGVSSIGLIVTKALRDGNEAHSPAS